MGDRPRLTRTGTGDDAYRTFNGQCGLPLTRVEICKNALGLCAHIPYCGSLLPQSRLNVYYCGNVTHRSNLTLAALASATMPGIAVSGTRSSNQASAGDRDAGIDLAIIQDGPGRLYDVIVSSTDEGKKRLRQRVKAAVTLSRAKEPGGLGFAMERILAYEQGENAEGPTGLNAVVIMSHCEGASVALRSLDAQDCVAIGTAIGAIHRLGGAFLRDESYPSFTTANIKQQLLSWISRLSKAGHIPQEIIRSWSDIVNTSGLWSFTTCPVHGGFDDGDFLFSDTSLTAVYNWQDMQINDPARDLAWIFAKLDEPRRNALIGAYGRMMGSRLDPMIMLRANLWLQMEQVGDFISALDHADNEGILQFKAQVEHLAHQLTSRQSAQQRSNAQSRNTHAPSTITVGTLLDNPGRVSEDHGPSSATPGPVQRASGETKRQSPDAGRPAFGESDRQTPDGQDHPLRVADEADEASSATIVVSSIKPLHPPVSQENEAQEAPSTGPDVDETPGSMTHGDIPEETVPAGDDPADNDPADNVPAEKGSADQASDRAGDQKTSAHDEDWMDDRAAADSAETMLIPNPTMKADAKPHDRFGYDASRHAGDADGEQSQSGE